MKTTFALLAALLPLLDLRAGDPAAEHPFENGNLALPPLSLQDAVRNGQGTTVNPPRYRFEDNVDINIARSTLLPADSAPGARIMREAARRGERQRVSSMLVIEPRADVDYKLRIKRPDPSVDFKMIVKDVAPPADAGAK